MLPVPDGQCDGLVVRARFADTRQIEVRRRDGTRKLLKRPGGATGGRDPYALIVRTDGHVDQMAELGQVTYHAGEFNTSTLGIAVVGNFTERAPTHEQWQTCVTLAALFGAWGLEHQGHTMLGLGASSDPSKVCPGPRFSLPQLRTAAAQNELASLSEHEAEVLMLELGFVL